MNVITELPDVIPLGKELFQLTLTSGGKVFLVAAEGAAFERWCQFALWKSRKLRRTTQPRGKVVPLE